VKISELSAGRPYKSAVVDISAGTFIGVEVVSRCLAFATIIFSGPLAFGFAQGAFHIAIAATITALTLALFSQIRISIGSPQDVPAAIVAAVVPVSLGASGLTQDVMLATALFATALTAALMAVAMMLSAHFRITDMVRIIPFPVLSGFLASSGYLILNSVLVARYELNDAGTWLRLMDDPSFAARLALAVGFGIVLYLVIHSRWPWMSLILAVLGVIAFNVFINVAGYDVETMRALGFLNPLTETSETIEWAPLMLGQVDWGQILKFLPTLVLAAVMGGLACVLIVNGIENLLKTDVDLDREVRITGRANLLSSCLGGHASFIAMSSTVLADRLGATGRGAPIAHTIVLIAGLLFLGPIISTVPEFVLVAMSLAIGADLLISSSWSLRKSLPAMEMCLVLSIVAVTIFIGIFEATAVGLVAATFIFAVRYGRLSVFKHRGDARSIRSRSERTVLEERVLDDKGSQTQIAVIQGYLFFGSIEQLFRYFTTVCNDVPETERVIFDFSGCMGLDPSAATRLERLLSAAENRNIALFMVNPPSETLPFLRVHEAIDYASLPDRNDIPDRKLILFDDMEAALNANENLLLSETEAESLDTNSLLAIFEAAIGPHPRLADLVAQTRTKELDTGEALMKTGQRSADIFFVLSGRVEEQLVADDGTTTSIRSVGPGGIIGEIEGYKGSVRSTDAIAMEPSKLAVLTETRMLRFELRDPELASLAHRVIATYLATKVLRMNRSRA
jgi:SulP family sulfate permease